jgi:hypothetical protein
VDEEARAQAYRDQVDRRVLAIDAREAALRGDANLMVALSARYAAIRNAGAELAPMGDYDGRYPNQHN